MNVSMDLVSSQSELEKDLRSSEQTGKTVLVNKMQMLKLSTQHSAQRAVLNGVDVGVREKKRVCLVDKRLISPSTNMTQQEDSEKKYGAIKLNPGQSQLHIEAGGSLAASIPRHSHGLVEDWRVNSAAARAGSTASTGSDANSWIVIDEAANRASQAADADLVKPLLRRGGGGKDGHETSQTSNGHSTRGTSPSPSHKNGEDQQKSLKDLPSQVRFHIDNQDQDSIDHYYYTPPSSTSRRSSTGSFFDSQRRAVVNLSRRFSLRRRSTFRRASRMATGAGTSADVTKDAEGMPSNFMRTDSIIIRVQPGQCFSEFSNVVVEPPTRSDPRLGTLAELRHHLRTGTKEQVKRFLRQNNWTSGHRIRAELWKELCRDNNSDAQRAVYRDFVQEFGNIPTRPAYLASPGVVLCDHQLKENGRNCLLRVLTAVEHQRPDFTYVPLLYPLGELFLHYMNEEEAFVCLMNLISQSQKFLIQSDIATVASKRTMLYLVKKHANRAYALFKRLSGLNDDKDLVAIFDEWKSWIFRDLPFSHLVRVVDCFLFEGQKVLFRVGLAIVHLWSKDREKEMRPGKAWTTKEIGNDIAEYCKAIKVQPPKLLKTAFGIRNLKMATVRRLQEKYEITVRQSNSAIPEVQKEKQLIQPYHYIDVKLDSNILDNNQAMHLISWIPSRYQLNRPIKLFSSDEEGTSFTRLWTKLESQYPTIVVIKTSLGEVFGAYGSTAWDTWKRQSGTVYFGTGETFLFRFPIGASEGEKFAWVGTKRSPVGHSEELFQSADATTLVVGGGSGDGLSIRQSLECGSSSHCETFDNPMLSSKRDFNIQLLEVFGFTSDQS